MSENIDAFHSFLQTCSRPPSTTKGDVGALWRHKDAPTLLQFLVRMGSFTSTPKLANKDSQDDDVEWPSEQSSLTALLDRCHQESGTLLDVLPRSLCTFKPCGPHSFRVLQWNVLSQALGTCNDNFVACPREALEWPGRRFRMLEELLRHSPDVICLQEVDHFKFLAAGLGAAGYRGTFVPKPDSPCIYLQGNNGPDGCALFYQHNKFSLQRVETRVLEVWRVASNQVALLAILEQRESGRQLCVVTTHLKARQGTFLSTLRNEQGRDLLRFLGAHSAGLPVVLCGDFNAEPTEPVYQTVKRNEASCPMASSYATMPAEDGTASGVEPAFTTWKIREDGEKVHTIDYIFYSPQSLEVNALLNLPSEKDIGPSRLPSWRYPSDHLSLMTDFSFC